MNKNIVLSFKKQPIDFNQPIVVSQYFNQNLILRKWKRKLEKSRLNPQLQQRLSMELFAELEQKTFLFAAINLIKKHYQISLDLAKIQIAQLNSHLVDELVLQEFFRDYQIQTDPSDLIAFQQLLPNLNQVKFEKFLLAKKFWEFVFTRFQFEFDYSVLLDYLIYKQAALPIASCRRFNNWRRLDQWCDYHDLKMTIRFLPQTFLIFLWKQNKWNFLNQTYLKKQVELWKPNKKQLINLQLKEHKNNNDIKTIKVQLLKQISNFDDLNFHQYQKLFINLFTTRLEKNWTPKTKDNLQNLLKEVFNEIIHHYLFFDLLVSWNTELI
ncbi:hypothetical protein J2Z62_000564 [Mycoplasmoides fastidiosum]|uniref:Uncharacterized protein n=1 Tax=Mycoplasmoides fastidiosum TaxID=92758 RepID=A0ABU0LZJ7_9BACT|nr:hypothetical protein [Mycoplasmoides fastidiosum]MDQ0514126.1 hypothetical protein [Mycoplasmoides fastidiosum]UUD37466.1 hypothetical protein NPA10_02750 [Mycoplasmoides fastidiosum]